MDTQDQERRSSEMIRREVKFFRLAVKRKANCFGSHHWNKCTVVGYHCRDFKGQEDREEEI